MNTYNYLGNHYYCLDPINPDYHYFPDEYNEQKYLTCREDKSKNLIHRIDGPAIEFLDGEKRWYYHGERIGCSSQEEFEKIIKMKAFL